MSTPKTKRLKLLLSLVVVLLILFGLASQQRNLLDDIALHGYQAPAVQAQLATQDTMTAYARKVFYVNHPMIEGKTTFNAHCPNNGGEQTIVLGCYHSDQAGIFLYQVTDSRLDGVEQVTAAHETLHAIYDRLSSSKRKSVDAMLLDYYNHGLTDSRIKTTIDAYKKTEPHDVVNEMHSIFGTEVANLPTPLEKYYEQYFTNRAAVVAYANQYQNEFTSRRTAVAQDDAQLAALKTQITADESDLTAKQTAITTEKNRLDSDRSSGDIADYNAGVPGYNAQIDTYNSEVETVQSLIGQYNTLVVSRNALALEEQQLANALSSDSTHINN